MNIDYVIDHVIDHGQLVLENNKHHVDQFAMFDYYYFLNLIVHDPYHEYRT